MATQLDIVSPEKLVISETVASVTVPGSEGYFTVLGDHAPLITTLKPGFVTAVDAAGATHSIYVVGGLAEVTGTGVTILADEARNAADFSRADVEARIVAAEAKLASADTLEAKDAAQAHLDQWRNLLLESATVGTVH
jgi:F-type H+-transporting ATPase subunit epsilon